MLHYTAKMFRMICMSENTLVCRTERMVSFSSQPKIDTCPQPDWVKEQLLTTMPSASLFVCVLLTRVWALASPPSALSINCSSVNSSSGSSSKKTQWGHCCTHICVKPASEESLLREQYGCVDFTHCSQPAMNKSPSTYLVMWEYQEVRGVVKLIVCLSARVNPL